MCPEIISGAYNIISIIDICKLKIQTYIVSPNVDFPFIEFFLAPIFCIFNPTPSSNNINVRTTGTGAESIWPTISGSLSLLTTLQDNFTTYYTGICVSASRTLRAN